MWFVSCQSQCQEAINSLKKKCGLRIENVCLGKGGAFCIFYNYDGDLNKALPRKIFYSKQTIPAHFENSLSVVKTIREMKGGKIDPEMIPPIRVVQDGNRWISLDNRRLFVLRNAFSSPISVIVLDISFKPSTAYPEAIILTCKCLECISGLDFTKSPKRKKKGNRKSKSKRSGKFQTQFPKTPQLLKTESFVSLSIPKCNDKILNNTSNNISKENAITQNISPNNNLFYNRNQYPLASNEPIKRVLAKAGLIVEEEALNFRKCDTNKEGTHVQNCISNDSNHYYKLRTNEPINISKGNQLFNRNLVVCHNKSDEKNRSPSTRCENLLARWLHLDNLSMSSSYFSVCSF